MKQQRGFGVAVVGMAYVLAMVVGYAVTQAAPIGWTPLVKLALADLAATIVVFVFSVAFDNTSVYDPYWSVAPVALAGWLAAVPGAERGFDLRQLVVLAVVGLYGVRLTVNWLRGWPGLAHEDWRYVAFRKYGKAYWPISFFGLHFFPTVMVFLGCLPLEAALTGPSGFGALDVVAAAVTVAGTLIELVADEQLRAFRRAKTNDGAICDVGLWSWSRHPTTSGSSASGSGCGSSASRRARRGGPRPGGSPWWASSSARAFRCPRSAASSDGRRTRSISGGCRC